MGLVRWISLMWLECMALWGFGPLYGQTLSLWLTGVTGQMDAVDFLNKSMG